MLRPARRLPALATSACIVLLVHDAQAQSLQRFYGGWEFGQSVAIVRDVNADGHDDVLVGDPSYTSTAGSQGRAFLFSGQDGSVLYEFNELDPYGTNFGWSVADAGDVDGDGTTDLLIGSSGYTPSGAVEGVARVYSGASGAILWEEDGSVHATSAFGYTVSGVGDIDQDGLAEFAVTTGFLSPTTRIYSVDGTVHHTAAGWAVADAGDVNADGADDYLVGSTGGNALVRSGADNSILYAFNQHRAFASAGDLNQDGYADFLIAKGNWTRVHSGFDGSELRAHLFRADTVKSIGDVDLDGFADYVAANNDTTHVYSGAPGAQRIISLRPSRAAAGLGDVDGDERPDLVVTRWPAGSAEWLVDVRSVPIFRDCTPAAVNSTGASATLRNGTNPYLNERSFDLLAAGQPVDQVAVLLASQSAGLSMPAGSSGTLCLGAPSFTLGNGVRSTASDGTASFSVDLGGTIGMNPILAGASWRFQVWFRDAGTSNFTNALVARFE